MPLEEMTVTTAFGVPGLCPEIVLLYKAKAPNQKDHDDFDRVLPKLGAKAKTWLADALDVCHPGHQWLAVLAEEKHED